MFAALTLTLILAQPDRKEIKLDPFIEKATKIDPADSSLRALQKARCLARADAYVKMKQAIEIGKWDQNSFEKAIHVQIALTDNLLELLEKPEDKIRCREVGVEMLKHFEAFIKARVEIGTQPSQDLDLARAYRIDAEIELLKLKESLKGK